MVTVLTGYGFLPVAAFKPNFNT